MMTQEEFMDVKQMRASGMTYAEIAEKTGYHRTTIAKWIKAGGPPVRMTTPFGPTVMARFGPTWLLLGGSAGHVV
jgi:hypothetical protein